MRLKVEIRHKLTLIKQVSTMKKELDIARKIEKLRLIMEEEDTQMMFDVAV
jgi:hypothetical protein